MIINKKKTLDVFNYKKMMRKNDFDQIRICLRCPANYCFVSKTSRVYQCNCNFRGQLYNRKSVEKMFERLESIHRLMNVVKH